MGYFKCTHSHDNTSLKQTNSLNKIELLYNIFHKFFKCKTSDCFFNFYSSLTFTMPYNLQTQDKELFLTAPNCTSELAVQLAIARA